MQLAEDAERLATRDDLAGAAGMQVGALRLNDLPLDAQRPEHGTQQRARAEHVGRWEARPRPRSPAGQRR